MRFNGKGYSLIELVIVIAIFAILAAIAAPNMTDWIFSADYRNASQQVLQVLRQGRSRAISRNLEQQVEFDLANNRYRLSEGNLSSNSTNFNNIIFDWTDVPGSVIFRRTRDCDVATDTSFQFNPNGSSSAGFICVMEAQNPTVRRYIVGIGNTNTGRVIID